MEDFTVHLQIPSDIYQLDFLCASSNLDVEDFTVHLQIPSDIYQLDFLCASSNLDVEDFTVHLQIPSDEAIAGFVPPTQAMILNDDKPL